MSKEQIVNILKFPKTRRVLMIILGVIMMISISLIAFNQITQTKTTQEHLDNAVQLVELRDYSRAIIEYRTALAINKKSIAAYLGLADIYIEQKETYQAKTILTRGYNITKNSEIKSKLEELE